MDAFFTSGDSLELFIKIFILVLIGGYSIFTVVVLNQVRVMNSLVHQTGVAGVLFFLALIQLIASISLFILATVIL